MHLVGFIMRTSFQIAQQGPKIQPSVRKTELSAKTPTTNVIILYFWKEASLTFTVPHVLRGLMEALSTSLLVNYFRDARRHKGGPPVKFLLLLSESSINHSSSTNVCTTPPPRCDGAASGSKSVSVVLQILVTTHFYNLYIT